MSNTLAIATVTQTLVNIFNELFDNSGVTGAVAAATRPDDTNNLPPKGVNIFLYQVSPNPHLRNADLPTRRNGSLVHRPQVALDLYYLFTFYGADATLEQQRLLAIVVRQLHAHPVLHHSDIVNAQNSSAFLDGSNLADQTELIKFVPINYSLEELSKLWSVFLKTDYSLSVAYMASVVLIETDDLPPATALPVLRPHLRAVPFSLTVIDSVQPQAVALVSPPAGTEITLLGQNLDPADAVTFLTPGSSVPIPGTISQAPSPTELAVQLPDGLRPGVNTVTLIHWHAASPPGAGRPVAQSNEAAFVLRPVLGPITVAAGKISALVTPAIGPNQKVYLLLNQIDPSVPGDSQAFQLAGTPSTTQAGVFDFPTNLPVTSAAAVSVPLGSYLARVRVDAAESALDIGVSGGFSGPIVTLS